MYTAPPYFSPSSLDTFNQCPKRFFYEKIQGAVSSDTEYTLRGSFVHEVLEYLFQVEPEKRTIELAKELSRLLWDKNWKERVEALGFSQEDLRKFRWLSWWCVENYFKMEDPTSFEPEGLEVAVEGTIEGVPFYGIIDRWSYDENGDIVITDYKTGKVPKPQYAGPKKMQLYIYADLMEQREEATCSNMQLFYVKDAEIVEYDPEEIREEARQLFVSSWDHMQASCDSGDFETRTSPLCEWCDFKDVCPAFN